MQLTAYFAVYSEKQTHQLQVASKTDNIILRITLYRLHCAESRSLCSFKGTPRDPAKRMITN